MRFLRVEFSHPCADAYLIDCSDTSNFQRFGGTKNPFDICDIVLTFHWEKTVFFSEGASAWLSARTFAVALLAVTVVFRVDLMLRGVADGEWESYLFLRLPDLNICGP